MTDNPIISIIVPIYNVELYISNTINSIITQNYDSFEVILVNDGSSDGSGVICEKFANTHDNIIYYYQENQGVSVARNKGIEISSGEWIIFVDGDDMLCPDSLSKIAENLNSNIDYYICRSKEELKNKEIFYPQDFDEKLYNQSIPKEELYGKYSYIRYAVWGCIFNKNFIEKFNIRYVEGVSNSEDVIFNFFALYYATRVGFLPVELAYVVYREGSASRSWSKQKVLKLASNLKQIELEIERTKINYRDSIELSLLALVSINSLIPQALKLNDRETLHLIAKTIKKSKLHPLNINYFKGFRYKFFLTILNISPIIYIYIAKLRYKLSKYLGESNI